MGDHRRHMSVAAAAAALAVTKQTVRRAFDATGAAAGERDEITGERLLDPAWVEAKAAAKKARPTRSVPRTMSVAEAAVRLRRSTNTIRRWFDRDQPEAGEPIEAGRTGSTERRCAEAWVERLEAEGAAGRVTQE